LHDSGGVQLARQSEDPKRQLWADSVKFRQRLLGESPDLSQAAPLAGARLHEFEPPPE
jgi:hypothetical protein